MSRMRGLVPCPYCQGEGAWQEDLSSHRYGHATAERRCRECDGEGVQVVDLHGDEADPECLETWTE